MKKRISEAFGKKVYLLGKDDEGTLYWLEAPSWDCGWYWGFGYIETYTNNNNPNRSQDITSHQHWEGTLLERKEPVWLVGYKEMEYKQQFPWATKTNNGKPYYHYHKKYVCNPYDNPYLVDKTFNEKEGWELGELFEQFYFLKEAAEMFNRGKANIATCTIDSWKDTNKVTEINEVIIPRVIKRIIEILTPEK